MELCRGGSIEDRIMRDGPLPEPVVINLAKQLLAGLNYLHCKRVVHRDIKPMNLLMLHEDTTRLKISDFNTARQLGSPAGCSMMLSARGTQLYAAPELALGLQWNERVDVWASGLSLFYMLRAEHPFPSTKRRHVRLLQKRCLPRVDWGTISKWMCNLLRLCLTVEMRDRPVPMELLEHYVFSHADAADPARGKCSEPTTLAACGLLMHCKGAVDKPSRSPHQQAMWDLAKWRYLCLEGEALSSCSTWAWAAPF